MAAHPRLKIPTPLWAIIGLAVACKPLSKISHSAYVIGNNDIHQIEENERTTLPQAELNASVLIGTFINNASRKFCSGTLIEPEAPGKPPRVLTNHHCFALEESEGKAKKELLPGHCSSTKVYFGFFRGNTERIPVADCLEGSFKNDYDADLAVFTLNSVPPDPYKPAGIWEGPNIPANRKALVVHYPTVDKPEDSVYVPSMGISLPLGQVTQNDCITGTYFPTRTWVVEPSLPMAIKHNCDLKHGSSGSALWDAETHKLLGVNWGGISLTEGDPPKTEVNNAATRAEYVKAFLAGNVDALLQQYQSELAKIRGENREAQAKKEKVSAKDRIKCGSVGTGSPPLVPLSLLVIAAYAIIRRRRTN